MQFLVLFFTVKTIWDITTRSAPISVWRTLFLQPFLISTLENLFLFPENCLQILKPKQNRFTGVRVRRDVGRVNFTHFVRYSVNDFHRTFDKSEGSIIPVSIQKFVWTLCREYLSPVNSPWFNVKFAQEKNWRCLNFTPLWAYLRHSASKTSHRGHVRVEQVSRCRYVVAPRRFFFFYLLVSFGSIAVTQRANVILRTWVALLR